MTDDAPMLHLEGRILRGPDDEVGEAWVHAGVITFERLAPSRQTDVVHLRGTFLPGLVDAHCHVGLEAHGGVPPEQAEAHALAERGAGALLLRDCGSPVDTRWIDERDDLPRIVRAGRHIARIKRYLRNYAHEIEPEDIVAYVRQEARRGDGWVKLVGDWIDRDAGDLTPCWPKEALAAAVEAAHELGARVTAHCFGEQVLHDVAEAGIDCVEHASGLTEETIALFAERDIAIVPTLINLDNFPSFADAGEAKFPAYAAHMRDLHRRRHDTIGAAHAAGLRIFAGADAGGHIPHGLLAREVAEMLEVGMTPREAIATATWDARTWLGHDGLTPGAPADLVQYESDPRDDVRVLTNPEHVILRGRIVA